MPKGLTHWTGVGLSGLNQVGLKSLLVVPHSVRLFLAEAETLWIELLCFCFLNYIVIEVVLSSSTHFIYKILEVPNESKTPQYTTSGKWKWLVYSFSDFFHVTTTTFNMFNWNFMCQTNTIQMIHSSSLLLGINEIIKDCVLKSSMQDKTFVCPQNVVFPSISNLLGASLISEKAPCFDTKITNSWNQSFKLLWLKRGPQAAYSILANRVWILILTNRRDVDWAPSSFASFSSYKVSEGKRRQHKEKKEEIYKLTRENA